MLDATARVLATAGLVVIGLLAAYAFVFISGTAALEVMRAWRNRARGRWTLREIRAGVLQTAIFGSALLASLAIVLLVASDLGLFELNA